MDFFALNITTLINNRSLSNNVINGPISILFTLLLRFTRLSAKKIHYLLFYQKIFQ